MDMHTVWAACAAGDSAARDTLLQENLSLVHFVAKQLGRTLSADADPDELVSIGTMGLMSAIGSFDPGRGLAFSTYAVPRIRGAILDELRKQDHVPRSIRRKAREIAHARETLMRSLGRAPKDAEVATQLGIDVKTLWRWQTDMERTVEVSLSEHEGDRDRTSPLPIETLRAEGDAPDDLLVRDERHSQLREALDTLKDQQRTVLSLYYFEEMTAREIAATINISESRVSQIRAQALNLLRHKLNPLQRSA